MVSPSNVSSGDKRHRQTLSTESAATTLNLKTTKKKQHNTGLTQGLKAAVAVRSSPAQLTDSSLPEIVDSNSKDEPEGITFNESEREQGTLSYILSFCLCKYHHLPISNHPIHRAQGPKAHLICVPVLCSAHCLKWDDTQWDQAMVWVLQVPSALQQ